jgi:hypothetical protein
MKQHFLQKIYYKHIIVREQLYKEINIELIYF